MTENELIEYIKPILKKGGFLKKNKRWIKTTEEFKISFLIQGSCYDKDNFYIRPGVFVNAIKTSDYYGHFVTALKQETPEQVVNDFEQFCREWTDKEYIKKILFDFENWERRNPLEKRRSGLCDYEKDPIPSKVCFSIPMSVRQYIFENF